ncbi:MAG: hypothetical protein U1G05_14235 [Kiritimatiellia bacterium]
MHPVIEITALHLGLAAVWIPPARRLVPEVHPAAAASLGYLLGATLLLAIHHVLNFADVHSAPLAWLGCAAAWAVLMRAPPAAPRPSSPRIRRDCLRLAALTLGGAGLRLADPLRHDSLAGGDSYLLLQYVHRFVDQGVVFHEYIAGIPVLLGSLRIRATPFDVLHFGPAVLAALGIPAFFSLGCALGGRKAGWLSAIGLAGCFGFLHVVSLSTWFFVQFSTLCLALPWLVLLTPEAAHGARPRHRIAGGDLVVSDPHGHVFRAHSRLRGRCLGDRRQGGARGPPPRRCSAGSSCWPLSRVDRLPLRRGRTGPEPAIG